MTQSISILGSTGSIGRQTLEVAEEMHLRVAAITARTGGARFEEQIRAFHPELAVLTDETAAADLRVRVADQNTKVLGGAEALLEAAALPAADTLVTAVVGTAGLRPTIAGIRAGKRIALANKETLVCAGRIVMAEAAAHRAEIVPVDSEHSAVFQCLQGIADRSEIRRILLTCSGGPFFGMPKSQIAGKKASDAIKHPNWSMGAKISVDSATLMNKGLEIIEAMRLYDLPLEKVRPVIHRQSVVHSLVELCDGAVLAQLGTPDMRLPIRYAFTWPKRGESRAEPLDLFTCGAISFSEPDRTAFPCLALAEQAAEQGGRACCVLNAANEIAVAAYLEDRIGFYDIPALVERALGAFPGAGDGTLDEILALDGSVREAVRGYLAEDKR